MTFSESAELINHRQCMENELAKMNRTTRDAMDDYIRILVGNGGRISLRDIAQYMRNNDSTILAYWVGIEEGLWDFGGGDLYLIQ